MPRTNHHISLTDHDEDDVNDDSREVFDLNFVVASALIIGFRRELNVNTYFPVQFEIVS